MYKFVVFGGTTEGRELAEFLASQKAGLTVCVATEYGESILHMDQDLEPSGDNIKILRGRMTKEEMVNLFQREEVDLIMDGTHPYAREVTENIKEACKETGREYLRVLRRAGRGDSENRAVESKATESEGDTKKEMAGEGKLIFVETTEEAIEYLNNTEGNILLTTGSKDLNTFKNIKDFSARVWARVLPMENSIKLCEEAGLSPAHIIGMQGPFTEELNIATLKSLNCRYLVTKDGGDVGGFGEKVSAAEKSGAVIVVIGRPEEEEGKSLSETISFLENRFGFKRKTTVTIVGIGPGNRENMTGDVVSAINKADCLIGAKRMLEAAEEVLNNPLSGKTVFEAVGPQIISQYIASHPEHQRVTLVMSGDSGFYSGTKNLLPLLKDYDVKILPGLSSLSVLCARLGISYEDVVTVSLHGREKNILPIVEREKKVFVLTGGNDGAVSLARTLAMAGLDKIKMHIGENLGYGNERITSGTPNRLAKGSYSSLSAILIENECPEWIVTPGLPDEAFLRMEGVPMTKSEVRAVSVSKLQLTEDAVCWDVGAGTGSVSVEMARQAKGGKVYAIEKNGTAEVLLRGNAENLSYGNIEVVSGTAPEALKNLPAPTHVFIGGSSGNVKDIIKEVLLKNPQARIVATAISLESISDMTEAMKEFEFDETEAVSISVAKDKKAGSYHLMTGQNPIYVFTMQCTGRR